MFNQVQINTKLKKGFLYVVSLAWGILILDFSQALLVQILSIGMALSQVWDIIYHAYSGYN